jgi:transposase
MKRSNTPTFLLELPLRVDAGQAARLRAHLEVARCFYNSLLGEGKKRLQHMRSDPAWQAACSIARSAKQERQAAFAHLRHQYGFSEYALHEYAKVARQNWLADHLDSTMAQTLATRAYRAVNRVCLGKAKRVRFKSKGRGMDSVEGKRNDTGMRFLLQKPEEGWVLWGQDRIPALIDWKDGVVQHGLSHPIKYVRLIRRKATSSQAKGADCEGNRFFVQLVLKGKAYQKPRNQAGTDMIGLDIGPSSLAIFPQQGTVHLKTFCEELQPDGRKKRRLERKMERQRRAYNPENYDEQGRVKKHGKHRLSWKNSQGYLATRHQHARAERKLAAHRKSLHGKLVNDLIRVGNHLQIEKTSFQSWQKLYGKSVALRAPGMFVAHLKRIVAKTSGTLREASTSSTRLSQYCHGCQTSVKKPLSQRWHRCACGVGPIQRDVYSAFLLAYLPSSETIPSIAQEDWEGAEPRLLAAMECVQQRAKEGHWVPRSFGITGARARRPKSLVPNRQEPVFLYRRGRLEALELGQEPSRLSAGEVSDSTSIHL